MLFLCCSDENETKNNSQVELENWVNSIHSACAAAFARHRGKTGTLHLLQEEIFRLDKAIESVWGRILSLKDYRGECFFYFYIRIFTLHTCPFRENSIKSVYKLIP